LYKPAPIRSIDIQMKRTALFMGLIILCTIPGLVVSPGDPLIFGFILGSIGGLLNGYLLTRRMRVLFDTMAKVGMSQAKAKSFARAGFVPRFLLVVCIIALASQTDFISIYGVGAGLLIPTLITVADANIALYRYFSARDAVDRI